MNSVSGVCVSESHTPHVCIEQAKLSRSSLRSTYEQCDSQTNQQLVWYNLVVWMNVRMTASYSLSKTDTQWFGEAKEGSYIYRVNKAGITK